eukprot:Platyproteum_vivax@DN10277_c0_g1_i1.p1
MVQSSAYVCDRYRFSTMEDCSDSSDEDEPGKETGKETGGAPVDKTAEAEREAIGAQIAEQRIVVHFRGNLSTSHRSASESIDFSGFAKKGRKQALRNLCLKDTGKSMFGEEHKSFLHNCFRTAPNLELLDCSKITLQPRAFRDAVRRLPKQTQSQVKELRLAGANMKPQSFFSNEKGNNVQHTPNYRLLARLVCKLHNLRILDLSGIKVVDDNFITNFIRVGSETRTKLIHNRKKTVAVPGDSSAYESDSSKGSDSYISRMYSSSKKKKQTVKVAVQDDVVMALERLTLKDTKLSGDCLKGHLEMLFERYPFMNSISLGGFPVDAQLDKFIETTQFKEKIQDVQLEASKVSAELLALILKSFSSLDLLHVGGNQFGLGLPEVLPSIPICNHLLELSVTGCLLRTGSEMAALLHKMPKLERLYCGDNHFGNAGLLTIMSEVACASNLQLLHANRSSLTDDPRLGEALQKGRSLKHINLSDNNLKNSGLRLVLGALKGTAVDTLHIFNTALKGVQAAEMLRDFAHSTNVSVINPNLPFEGHHVEPHEFENEFSPKGVEILEKEVFREGKVTDLRTQTISFIN